MKKRIGGWMAIMLLLLGALIPNAVAFLGMEEQNILKGLSGVRVEVKRLKPEIERDGLFRDTLQTDVELKLRMSGMKVLSEDEADKAASTPSLYLNLDALKCSVGYAYRIQLSLREWVTLVRKPLKVMGTTFRTTDRFAISPNLADIREDVRDVVDDFIKAWLEANSK